MTNFNTTRYFSVGTGEGTGTVEGATVHGTTAATETEIEIEITGTIGTVIMIGTEAVAVGAMVDMVTGIVGGSYRPTALLNSFFADSITLSLLCII